MANRSKSRIASTRNPDRTRERILKAALAEFSMRGFAGARVDSIAKHASINKRMLYHYFGNKRELFRAVLRQKISERRAWSANLSNNPAERLPFWFKTACADADWIRLLEWEALQNPSQKVIDEEERRSVSSNWVERIRERQAKGQLSSEFDPRHLALAMQSLTMFPTAFPQLTRLLVGRPLTDSGFQRDYQGFLKKIAEAFQPRGATEVEIHFAK